MLALVVGAAHPHLPATGPWSVVAVPVVAGLLHGPLVHRFAPAARGGVPEVVLAVARRGGRIRPRVVLVKALASSLCTGGGGSVGRDGPMVGIGAAMGSSPAQRLRCEDGRVRLLVARGAAGGPDLDGHPRSARGGGVTRREGRPSAGT